MALPANLTTNEVKDAAGTEVEFLRRGNDVNSALFLKSGESPALQHRISIRHGETGVGFKRRRRSNITIFKDSVSGVDLITPVRVLCSLTIDVPVGALAANTEILAVLANMISFVASDGSNTTVKYDGTGTGAAVLANGTL